MENLQQELFVSSIKAERGSSFLFGTFGALFHAFRFWRSVVLVNREEALSPHVVYYKQIRRFYMYTIVAESCKME